MPKVFMNETVGVQTVGAGGIGMIPPVPVETVEKIDGNVREMHEVTAPAGRIPNPVGKEDGETINIQDEGYVTSGFSVPDPKNASDNMVLAVEDGEYKIVDPSVQTDVADLVADPYSTESTYAVGDPTVYENELYICNTAITQGEAWTAAHWTKKPLGEAMVDGLGTKVNKTQTVNGKALSGNITLTAEDIGYDDTVDPHSANSLGAAVSDLKSDLTEFESVISDTPYIKNNYENTQFVITKETGKYTNYFGEYVSNPSFDAYQFQVPKQSGIYFDGVFTYLSMCVYSALPISGDTCVSGRITGDSLPTSETPYTVNSGYYVVISINHSDDSLGFYSNYNSYQIKNSVLGGVLSTGYRLNTLDDTDFTVTKISEKYTGYDGGFVNDDDYTSYQIVATEAFDIYFDTSGNYLSACVYSDTPSASTCVSGRLRDATLPNSTRPYHVETGYYVVITIKAWDVLAFYSNYNNQTFSNGIDLSSDQIEQIRKLYSPNCDLYVANQVISADNYSRLTIFTDLNTSMKLRIDLYKYIVSAESQATNANSNVWVMGGVYTANNSFQTLDTVINPVEWDCAIKEVGASDFMGGKQHGDEVYTEWHIFADGKEIDPTQELTPFKCSSIDLVQTSKLNRVGDPTDYLIEHAKHTKITRKNVFIEQTFKALQTFNVNLSYVAMLSLAKDYADKFIRRGRSVIEDITSANYTSVGVYGTKAWADIISDKSIIRFEADSDSDMTPSFYISKGSNDHKCYYTMNKDDDVWEANKLYTTHFNVSFEVGED